MSSRTKKLARRVALLIFSCVAVCAVGEVLTRIFLADEIPLFPRYHTDVQYGDYTLRRVRPNSEFWHRSADGAWYFETNSQGFRNRRDFSYQKPPGVVRILSLGDSHTQGFEVRQDFTFSAVMQKSLQAQGIEAQVLNTGVSGFSTAEQVAFLENEGIRYEPDFVVLGFYANDLEDNLRSGLFQLDPDGTLSVAKMHYVPGVRAQDLLYKVPMTEWMGENSYLYSIVFNGVWQFFKNRLERRAFSEVPSQAEFAVPTKRYNSEYEIKLQAALLSRMKRFCEDNGIRLIVLDIPTLSRDEAAEPVSSLPAKLTANPEEWSHALVSDVLLSDYAGVAELHRPRGLHHITEFSHTVLGVEAAKYIAAWLEPQEIDASQENGAPQSPPSALDPSTSM